MLRCLARSRPRGLHDACKHRQRPLLATSRRRLVLGARVARAPQDRLLPAPHHRRLPAGDPRGRDQGRDQGPGARRRRHRLGRRAAPRQRRRLLPGAHARRRDPAAGQDLLLRLLRRRRAQPAPGRRPERPLGLVDDLRFTREYTDEPIKFSFTGPFSLSRRVQERVLHGRGRPRAWPSRRSSTARRARWRRAAPPCCRSTSRSWPATRTRSTWRSTRSTPSSTASQDRSRRVHVCYGNRYAGPSGKATTTSSSRPSSRRTSTSSCSSSRARATTTSSCSSATRAAVLRSASA